MKRIDQQLQRLLRAASAAPAAAREIGTVPDARALLQQRERELAHAGVAVHQLFRLGLATACVLLVATLAVGRWQIAQANADVFAASELALTHISTP
jgi:hypothetical protein